MLHYRKNVGGEWKLCSLTVEEAKVIQDRLVKLGLGKYKDIIKVAEENKLTISNEAVSVILSKVLPSYESLANDFIEGQIKRQLEAKANPAPTTTP